MGLLDATKMVQNGDFVRSVEAAVVQAALNVASEDPATASHAARLTLSSKILVNPNSYANLFALAVALNSTIQTDYPASTGYNLNVSAATSDSDIQFVVNSVYNAYI